jgi:hypothetical protein
LLSRRMFFHGLAVTLLAAASASQAACIVTTRRREPRVVRRPMRHRVYWSNGPRGRRALIVPRNVMVGDELLFENGKVFEVRGVYPNRVDVARGNRTVAVNAEYQ